MKLQQIKGSTYALESDTAAIGLYLFEDRSCLLIDSGPNQKQAAEVLQILGESGWVIWGIFNTHAHADHCGGNQYIQKEQHCQILASEIEATFINHPILTPYSMYSAHPIKLLTGKFLMPAPSQVSRIIGPGVQDINGIEFEILDLTGHSLGQLGIITPDGILFVGDSLIAQNELELNPFLYVSDLGKQFETMEMLRAKSHLSFYLSHGGEIENVPDIIDLNYGVLNDALHILEDILRKPCTREEIMREVIARKSLQVNRNHYFRLWASISAFLSYLCDEGQAIIYTEDNYLKFSLK
ncbi:zinc metallohydrolase, glyoxalase ii family [hydrocarbon metagenome]|uniref:Zinc metallohydrolase, glyoxalase ii family n=1 Tax=hydrocarbon metagenome TaxID=938273 RepID=A0A0W8E1Y6_9ZZZZ